MVKRYHISNYFICTKRELLREKFLTSQGVWEIPHTRKYRKTCDYLSYWSLRKKQSMWQFQRDNSVLQAILASKRIHRTRYRSASPGRSWICSPSGFQRLDPLISIIITSPYVFEPVFTIPCRVVDAYWWRVYIRRGAPRRRCKVTSRSSISDHTGV